MVTHFYIFRHHEIVQNSHFLSDIRFLLIKQEIVLRKLSSVMFNKPRTAKVGAISKAQNLKGGPFGLCETPAGCKKL